jgi:hypothetical protein
MLDAFDGPPGIALIPEPIEVLGHQAELDDEVVGQVFWLSLAPFLAPEADQFLFVDTHDDPGIGAADEMAAIGRSENLAHSPLHAMSSAACSMVPVTSAARSARIASTLGRSRLPGALYAVSSRTTVTGRERPEDLA